MNHNRSRRNFIKLTGLGLAAGSAFGTINAFTAPLTRKIFQDAGGVGEKLNLGICSYSFRSFPLTETISMIRRIGVTKVCLKDIHLSLKSSREELLKAADEIRLAGLDLYTAGVVYMKSEEEVNNAFEYAKILGMKLLVGVPEYSLLDYAEQKVKEYNIGLAIHNHGPNDKRYPSPTDVYDRVKNRDPRIGMCLDIGHTMRLGIDPSIPAEQYFDRILDCHIKNVSKAAAEGSTVELGRGVIDIPKFFKTLIRLNYKGVISLEYEKDSKDPLAGTAESVGYARGVLSAI